jgi:hypothetical protein
LGWLGENLALVSVAGVIWEGKGVPGEFPLWEDGRRTEKVVEE